MSIYLTDEYGEDHFVDLGDRILSETTGRLLEVTEITSTHVKLTNSQTNQSSWVLSEDLCIVDDIFTVKRAVFL